MQTTIPATGDYLALGLVVVFTILLLFIASLVIRYRNLSQDAKLIDQLEDK